MDVLIKGIDAISKENELLAAFLTKKSNKEDTEQVQEELKKQIESSNEIISEIFRQGLEDSIINKSTELSERMFNAALEKMKKKKLNWQILNA